MKYRKKGGKEMYTYTESEVKKLCWELLNSFTNIEDLKDPVQGLKKDFNYWFTKNKK